MKITKDEIKLGPLLGIEGNSRYTVCFLSKIEYNIQDIVLEVYGSKKLQEISLQSITRLESHFFYRFEFDVELFEKTNQITYEICKHSTKLRNVQGVNSWEFIVPGTSVIPKIAFASCSGTENYPTDLKTKDYIMWKRLITHHYQDLLNYSFHCLLLGGDQIYTDSIWDRVPYFKKHRLLSDNQIIIDHKIKYEERQLLEKEIARFYEQLYIDSWSNNHMSQALASIPNVMIWDDHDIFDGWGSFSNELQTSDIFQLIFKVAKQYFEVFQVRSNANQTLIAKDIDYSMHLTFRNYEIILLDNRSYRSEHSIMSDNQYKNLKKLLSQKLFKSINDNHFLNKNKVINFVIPVPVAHLDYKKRTEALLKFWRQNRFIRSLHDDGLDHWDHEYHKEEQKNLLDLIIEFGNTHEPDYLNIISGDVHSAGAALVKNKENRLINQLIASPMVNHSPSYFTRAMMLLSANKESQISEYKLSLQRFGSNWKKTIYSRNFGFLYKAQGSGLKAYLRMENNPDGYDFKQLAKFKGSSSDYLT